MEQSALRRIGEMIREVRKKKGFSQEELAEAVGTKHTEIGRLERGERNITVRNLEKIAHALGMDFFELLGEGIRVHISKDEQRLWEIQKIISSLSDKDYHKALTILRVMFDEETTV